ncbi:NAD(P)/FAD-dependent oxidoreductase [Roseomonas sp. OT10]|uniref:flavin-containing monooxygenase n=1 Tax=Roseomonas cutis TaxID=2897332 RepID=UPI001E56FEAE|nr:NAD(P)/FAD-dependent oxidoreductase [Roseomonas sp. OT10]UFN50098.1 NAD(P)/FAD-dependent oxidoreductase [Roseomonas sp. OT10]
MTDAAETVALLEGHIRAGAELPVLLMATAHLTGDHSLLTPGRKPGAVFGKLRCEVEPAERETILAACVERLRAFLAAGAPVPPLTFDVLHRIAAWAVGKEIEPFVPLLAEEMVLGGQDPRRPGWSKARIAPDRPFSVGIVGGGESGIIAAIRLAQAGIPYTLYEKNDALGGTWLENRYPGCRVDINSYVYSYASAPVVWPEYFGQQPDVLAYLQDVARRHGVDEQTRLNCAVRAARWDEAASAWKLRLSQDGAEVVRTHQAVIFAVGQLNRPALPDIPGRDEFAGPAFHSARWDHATDLDGKDVGVIGTGASACQFIPKLAERARSVRVFARTTTWLLPTPELHEAVPDSARWLMANLPAYQPWYRASMLMMQGPGLLDRITHDPAYPASETAISESNDALRASLQGWIEAQIADRPDLRDALIPDSPVGAKRILRDNGAWIRALRRDNLRVVRTRIERIVPGGLVTTDGEHHRLDALIYGTGFQAARFLHPMTITGRGGVDLHEYWGANPRAYLGLTVPNFPNMFVMYGPNTNLVVHGGSIILFSELSAKYILSALRCLLEDGARSLEVRDGIHETYNARVDETNARRAWGWSGVSSWYKNSEGRVTQNFPFTIAEYWQRTDRFEPGEYLLR